MFGDRIVTVGDCPLCIEEGKAGTLVAEEGDTKAHCSCGTVVHLQQQGDQQQPPSNEGSTHKH